MNADELPFIDIASRGGPAALLFQSNGFMVVISAYGNDDLLFEMLPQSMRGQSLWPKSSPVCQELLARLTRISNFPIARFALGKRKVTYYEYTMETGQ